MTWGGAADLAVTARLAKGGRTAGRPCQPRSLCRSGALRFPPVKINNDDSIRPTDFDDETLNTTFGTLFGKLSDIETQAIAFRYTEIRVARAVRQAWLSHVQYINESSAPNHESTQQVQTDPMWTSVAAETLAFLAADKQMLDNEELLAKAHIALCDRVIAELKDSLEDAPLATGYASAGQRTGSALRYLKGSAAAFNRSQARISVANEAWSAAIDGFAAEAETRNGFANGPASIQLAHIDQLSPDAFEEQTSRLLERDGCKIVRRRGGANDQGADVIALTPRGKRVVLQCKHSTKPKNRVDPRYVHELNGTAWQEHHADIAVMVTNRTLSDAAQRFADKHGIHVIDRATLERWATYGVPWLPSDPSGEETPEAA